MSDFYGYVSNCDCSYCKEEHKREVADKEAAERAASETKEAHPVPTSRLLTLEMVLKGWPCSEYRNRFTERYGETGVEVTVEKALSESNDWDWEWAAARLLSRKAKAEFSRRSREADKAYDDVMKPYWELVDDAYNRYYEVRDEAAREADEKGLNYGARRVLMNKASEGILDVPHAAQKAADEIADRRRRNARITAFAELFIADGPAYEEEHKNDEPFVNPYEGEYDEYDAYDAYDEDH